LSISEDKYRRLRQELIGGIFALIVVFLLGTLWYHLIEGWSWLDSAYMTISTLATVGFGEINPLGERGRLFTMVLIVMGVNYIVVQGDATLDKSLQMAGIERAICIVAALTSDAENLYTVLSAKTLNPKIRAIARASTEEAVQKLQRAGADAVVSPYITGGRRLAAAALRPQVMDFVPIDRFIWKNF